MDKTVFYAVSRSLWVPPILVFDGYWGSFPRVKVAGAGN